MGDAEAALPPSKKRIAGRQLTKDDPDSDDDAPESEMGTFKKASEEVMATRRIVKVRRNQPPPTASLNPFAGIRLVAPADSSAQATKPDNQPETGDCTAPPEQNDTLENSITDVSKGTEIIDSVNKIEDTEENSSKLDEISKPSSTIGDDKVENTAIEEKTQPVETSKETKDVEAKNDGEAIKRKNEDNQEEIEEEAKETEEAGGKTEAKETEEAGAKTEAKETEETGGKAEAKETNEARGETEIAVKEIEEVQEKHQKDPALPAAPLSSFQQLSSSQNAFSGLSGTGFSTSSFTFGSFAKEGSTFGTTSASLFASKSENSSLFSFGTGSAANGDSLPSLGATPDASKSVKFSMQEMPIETGEENEKAVFTADAIMYEYLDGGWKERGKGELKLNVSISDIEKARLIMRARGNYRLILNASLYPDMSLTNMDKRGVTFACVNSSGEGKDGLTTVALKLKDSSIVHEFRELVMAHKGKKTSDSETPNDSTKEPDT